jgi:TonB-dependent receptor
MPFPHTVSLLVTRFSLVILLGPVVLLGQGTIRGTVTDSVANTPLVGANVYLLGTALGGTTDLEGKYMITRIPEGAYTLKVSYVGYKPKELGITVPNAEITLDARLTPDIILGPEVVVTAQARGQVAAINQQITSNTIVNVVSEERIQELPDVNAAEVIGRMPGVSILRSGGEANKVILRGLSDRFTSFTIDGVRIAPTDSNSRGVDLSMISQGSLAGIELFKALMPDQDADAVAGSVNFVTRKAPSERLLRLDAKGDYNRLMDTFGQYDFALRYGERFFDDVLGVQVTGNLERRNRSNERININYNQSLNNGRDYEISNFLLEFNNEIRTRNGIGVLLDLNTPDNGSVRFNTIYSKTKRDYLFSRRNYPYGTGVLITYSDEDRVQEISTFNSSLHGSNYLLGLNVNWGASFAQSIAEDPYDYYIDFQESSLLDPVTGEVISGMMSNTPSIKDHPETLIPYALNNFAVAYLNNAFYQSQKNLDKDRTAFLDLARKFTLGSAISNEVKIGGKYKYKNRFKETGQLYAPYYLGFWRDYTRLPDGTLQKKNFDGTWFQTFYDRYVQSGGLSRQAFASDFLDPTPLSRDLYGKYTLKPIVNRDALKLWYELNKNGVDVLGRSPEYYDNLAVDADYYDIIERVQAAYVMNTLNVGQNATLISGVRVETERNDYSSRFSPGSLAGFPIPTGAIRDTSATYSETIWLPNFQLTVRPTDFMNARLAAYRALSRPDFNLRLEKYVGQGGGGNVSLLLGNPQLRTAKAWNYEVNTSFFSNTIGLLSLSAFYKEIKDMYHLLSGAGTMGNKLIDSLGIGWRTPFPGGTQYALTVPYNSSKPTRVWGFEFEHQINLSFLSGFLQNFVLSYNASIVRSETHLISTGIDTTYQTIPGFPFPLPVYNSVVVDRKQKLEGQPEFYGNISLGYDVGGFSVRFSVFHQAEYNRSFTASGLADRVNKSFTRLDLALKQQITNNISLIMNVNNMTNVEESTLILNRDMGWRLLDTSERYGLTADFGVRISY